MGLKLKQEAKVIWRRHRIPIPLAVGYQDPRVTQCFMGSQECMFTSNNILYPISRICTVKPSWGVWQTDWQTRRTSVTIVCISCIRCSLIKHRSANDGLYENIIGLHPWSQFKIDLHEYHSFSDENLNSCHVIEHAIYWDEKQKTVPATKTWSMNIVAFLVQVWSAK